MTVTGIRDGERYPDLRTLARLGAVGTSLLPDWPSRGASPTNITTVAHPTDG